MKSPVQNIIDRKNFLVSQAQKADENTRRLLINEIEELEQIIMKHDTLRN